MANINASALNSLQTRINAERSRRSLSPVTFTDGTLSAGGTIKATHFAELRTYTAGLNTLGSQTFNWSGTVSVGASITDVVTQISNFVTTLEGEALVTVGWKVKTPDVMDNHYNNASGSFINWDVNGGTYTNIVAVSGVTSYLKVFTIPTSFYGNTGNIRITYNGKGSTAGAIVGEANTTAVVYCTDLFKSKVAGLSAMGGLK